MNDKDELLKQLRDVELPDVAGTLAPGWWLLLLLLTLMVIVAFLLKRRKQARLWQREARAELQHIRDQVNQQPSLALLSQCSQLTRKVVLAVDQREQVAALHGEQWLEKLDDICARPEFTQGIGRVLVDQPYQKQPNMTAEDLSALLDSVDVLISSAAKYKPTVISASTDVATSALTEATDSKRSAS